MTASAPPRTTNPLSMIWRGLASYWLSVASLGGMFILVYFGTLAQVDHGLHKAQKDYFESWVCIVDAWGPLSFPSPGGLTLMLVLTINLIVGGIINMRFRWSRAGVLITHLGIALMMLAGFVKFTQSVEGTLLLNEGEKSSEFQSMITVEVAIVRQNADDGQDEWIIPEASFASLGLDEDVTFTHDDLPFDLELRGFFTNTKVTNKGPDSKVTTPVVNGHFVKPLDPRKTAENNFQACYARVLRDDQVPLEGILWIGTRAPWSIEIDGVTWGVKLRRQRWNLPFTLRLDDFIHKTHPNTGQPREFTSDVTALALSDDSEIQKARITMNQPLRRDDFILFQSGFDGATASRLSVVNNPSDQWPLYSCIITALGMIIHFVWKLVRHIKREWRTA